MEVKRPLALLSVLALILLLPCVPSQGEEPPRYSRVEFDLYSTEVISGGISQWGSLNFGIVNRTTVVHTRLMNKAGLAFQDIQVNFTVYWYDGPQPDRGKVMHKDFKYVDIEAGDGSLSDRITYEWTPRYAGAYAFNLSCHVPGDPNPITDIIGGLGRYFVTQSTNFHFGWWVGTHAWNCSSLDGWNTSSSGGPEGLGWHVSSQTLARGEETLHTSPTAFWVGDELKETAPTNGSYSLISPTLDLSMFNPNAYQHEWRSGRPQIYLLYKYRGNISSLGPNGEGGLFHYVSIDGGANWTQLRDNKDLPVVLNGNTTDLKGNPIWAEPTHPSYHGDTSLPGIELGKYCGKRIRVKLEYRTSGRTERGYLIDDIVMVGKELVDITPFTIVSSHGSKLVKPGSPATFFLNISSQMTIGTVPVRVQCIGSSGSLDMERDVTIRPEIFEMGEGYPGTRTIRIDVDTDDSTPSGIYRIAIRVLGGGTHRDVEFEFEIEKRRDLTYSLSGIPTDPLLPGYSFDLGISLENGGNEPERLDYAYVNDLGISVDGSRGTRSIPPGGNAWVNLTVRLNEDQKAGNGTSYMVVSRQTIEGSDEEILRRLDDIEEFLIVEEVPFEVAQVHSLSLISPSRSRFVTDPPRNGSMEVKYEILVVNSGNGPDTVRLEHEWLDPLENVSVRSMDPFTLKMDETRLIELVLNISFPVPEGIYSLRVRCASSGEEDPSDNYDTLTLSIGDEPVERGLYILGSSVVVEPSETIMGIENLLTFDVRSFGLPDHSMFLGVLMIDGVQSSKRSMTTSSSLDTEVQIPFTFNEPGQHQLTIRLEGENISSYHDENLLTQFTFAVRARHVQFEYVGMQLLSGDEVVNTTSPIDPGIFDVRIAYINTGDMVADSVRVTLIVVDTVNDERRELFLRDESVPVNTTRELMFTSVDLKDSRSYRLIVEIDSENDWVEIDETDNDVAMEFRTGSEPPRDPLWRNKSWVAAVFLVVVLFTAGLFVYLLRKKL